MFQGKNLELSTILRKEDRITTIEEDPKYHITYANGKCVKGEKPQRIAHSHVCHTELKRIREMRDRPLATS